MKIALFIESRDHIQRNQFYVNSLCMHLDSLYDVDFFDLQTIKTLSLSDDYDLIVSVFRLKTFAANCERFERILNGRTIHVLDHDPWEQFIVDSPYLGYYQKIAKSGVNAVFNVSSKFWSDRINKDLGLKCVSHVWGPVVPPGREKSYIPWESRENLLGFSGADYPWRIKNHNYLKSNFPQFEWKMKMSYSEFEKYLFNLQIWLQSEKDGRADNSLWPKALEVISYGVFMIRDYQEESIVYEIDKIPTAFLFREYEEIPSIIEYIQSMSPSERRRRILTAIEIVSEKCYIENVAKKLTSQNL